MKLKVIAVFQDKNSRKHYWPNDVIDVNKERAEVLIEAGVAQKISAPVAEETHKKAEPVVVGEKELKKIVVE